jgi:hypothetical protein
LINFSDTSDRWLLEKSNHARDAILEMVSRGAGLTEILSAIHCASTDRARE